MSKYIYIGSIPFMWNNLTLAEHTDVIEIEGNSIKCANGQEIHGVPTEILENLVADCTDFANGGKEDITINPDVLAFTKITNKMCDIFTKKNHDYGNSFEQSLNEEGLAAARIRMGDKWNRFKTLSKGTDMQVNDESLRDTLVDLANYSIMTVMWLDKQ